MLLRLFAGLVGLTARHLARKGTVTGPELARAMAKALEDMKAILRRAGLKVDPDPKPKRAARPSKRRGKAR